MARSSACARTARADRSTPTSWCWRKASTACSAQEPDCARRPSRSNVALAVKEMHFLPAGNHRGPLQSRGDEGAVIEAAGTISQGMTGMGFIYTNKESISLGIGCLVADFAEDRTNAVRHCWKIQAASFGGAADRRLGSQGICRASHSRRRLQGDPAALRRRLGRRAATPRQLNNAVHREGSNLAMTSGRIAGGSDLPDQVAPRSDDEGESVALQEDARRVLRHEGFEEI